MNLRNGLHRQPKWLLAPLIGCCMHPEVVHSAYFQYTAGIIKLNGQKVVGSYENIVSGNYEMVRREAKTNLQAFIKNTSRVNDGGQA